MGFAGFMWSGGGGGGDGWDGMCHLSDLWVKMEGGLWLRVEAEGLAGCFDCEVWSERPRVGDRKSRYNS